MTTNTKTSTMGKIYLGVASLLFVASLPSWVNLYKEAKAHSNNVTQKVNASPIGHEFNMIRTYTDTNNNGLYDTLETKIYADGKLRSDRTTLMGKECTKAEVEKITADRTPYETVEFK